jgi:hypothetical protein
MIHTRSTGELEISLYLKGTSDDTITFKFVLLLTVATIVIEKDFPVRKIINTEHRTRDIQKS